jgi:hypothetical protein
MMNVGSFNRSRLIRFVVATFALFYTSGLFAQESPKSIDVKALRQMDVIGELGVPLGKVVAIEAEIISGDSLKYKSTSGQYLLKVISVDGTKLKQPPLMFIGRCPATTIDMPCNHFELYKFREGKDAKRLDSEMIKKLEKGLVGKKLKLRAYESGGFHGIPNLPSGAMDWQDVGFGFSTHLVLLDEVKQADAVPAKGDSAQ